MRKWHRSNLKLEFFNILTSEICGISEIYIQVRVKYKATDIVNKVNDKGAAELGLRTSLPWDSSSTLYL